MKPLYTTFTAANDFWDEELALREKLGRTLGSKRYSSDDRVAFERALDPGDAMYLFASSPDGRLIWAAAFARRVLEHFGIRSDAARLSHPVYHLTLACNRYATTDDAETDAINVKSLAAWTRQLLSGLNFIGMIEPAYYTNYGRHVPGSRKRLVSWHLHLLLWDIQENALAQLVSSLNDELTSVVPGTPAALPRLIPKSRLPHRLFYMLKSPRNRYRIFPKRAEVMDPSTGEIQKVKVGFHQKKDDLRPAERVRLLRLMNDLQLHHLAVAGGRGKQLLAAIKAEAFAPLRRSERGDRLPRGPAYYRMHAYPPTHPYSRYNSVSFR